MPFQRPPDSLVIEGIVTSCDANGQLNVAPMGPILTGDQSRLCLRPFQTATTCQNLCSRREGVFHLVDDVRLIARGAIGRWDNSPTTLAAQKIHTPVLADACQSWEFEIEEMDLSEPRATLVARIVHRQHHRDFVGFNRARFAVLEAAILTTRLHLLDLSEVTQQFDQLDVLVEKTGSKVEREAMDLLRAYLEERPTDGD